MMKVKLFHSSCKFFWAPLHDHSLEESHACNSNGHICSYRQKKCYT